MRHRLPILIIFVLLSLSILTLCQPKDESSKTDPPQKSHPISMTDALSMLETGKFDTLSSALWDSVNIELRDTISTLIVERNILSKYLDKANILKHNETTNYYDVILSDPIKIDTLRDVVNLINSPAILVEAVKKYTEILYFYNHEIHNIIGIQNLKANYSGPRYRGEVEGHVKSKLEDSTYTVAGRITGDFMTKEMIVKTAQTQFRHQLQRFEIQCYQIGTIEKTRDDGFADRIPLYKEAKGIPAEEKQEIQQMINRYQEVTVTFKDSSVKKLDTAAKFARDLFPVVQTMVNNLKQNGFVEKKMFPYSGETISGMRPAPTPNQSTYWEPPKWRSWDIEEFQEFETRAKLWW